MENCYFLELLIEKARQRVQREDGKISVNGFILEFVKLAKEIGAGGNFFPEEERAAHAADEIDFAMAVATYAKCVEEPERFENVISEGGPDGDLEDILFAAVKEPSCAADGKISLVVVIREIFDHPTELIKKALASEEPPKSTVSYSALVNKYKASQGKPTASESHEPPKYDWEDGARASDRDAESEEEQDPAGKFVRFVEESKKLSQNLLNIVYGQDHAVSTLVSGYFQSQVMALTQKNRRQPSASFLFVGPPGVGKTFLAENVAAQLGLPFRRFDMSEYADDEEGIVEFCGSDKVYKNAKAGNVTSFVAQHPRCVLLFDEVEKAHLKVIYLFLQVLDAGRIRDSFTDEEVSFKDTIIIFTTNAGKQLYEDLSINLATVPRKTILSALSKDIDPTTHSPLFPAAICSRFASGNVVMFNHLGANDLLKIVSAELKKHSQAMGEFANIQIDADKNVPYSLLFSEGGNVDARTIKGKTSSFLYQELYELFRLLESSRAATSSQDVRKIRIEVELPEDQKVQAMFKDVDVPEALVFADKSKWQQIKGKLGEAKAHFAASVAEANDILLSHDPQVILVDPRAGMKEDNRKVLNLEDIISDGRDFFYYCAERVDQPLYMLVDNREDISPEEEQSFLGSGSRGILYLGDEDFATSLRDACNIAHQQQKLIELAKSNKLLSFKTAQSVNEDGQEAVITLYDYKLVTAVDAEDSTNVMSNISKPNIRFDDVIGAEDAKDELKYFVEFLKAPAKYLKKGLRPPKGILLYGPPGTGKTLLAKAMAGETDVTFITAEGNQFLKSLVGEGAASVHELFAVARKYAPSILFVDEVDAIAQNRSSKGAEYTADVLTSFLTEMDGFSYDPHKPVFLLAATNYSIEAKGERSLDPALLRRFDRKILVDLPGKDERARFIRLKMGKNPALKFSDGQVDNIAVRSTGMSLADLDSIIELALRDAVKTKNLAVDDQVLDNAFESYNSGEVKQWDPSELERTARHEVGHTLLCFASGETPSYLTIVARGNYGGYMQHGDNEKKGGYTKQELIGKIRTSMAGRAAELVYYGEEDGVSTGASQDLANATAIAQQMICLYGMDEELGLGSIDLANLELSPYYDKVMSRVNEILHDALEYAKSVIAANRALVDELVETLLKMNHLKGEDIEKALKGKIKL